jgi:hypothetical protein
MRKKEKKKADNVSSLKNQTREVFKEENISLFHSSKYFDDACAIYKKLSI